MWLALAGRVAVAISPRITGGVSDQCCCRPVVKILFTRTAGDTPYCLIGINTVVCGACWSKLRDPRWTLSRDIIAVCREAARSCGVHAASLETAGGLYLSVGRWQCLRPGLGVSGRNL